MSPNLIAWSFRFVLHSGQLRVSLFSFTCSSESASWSIWCYPLGLMRFSSPSCMFSFFSVVTQLTGYLVSLTHCYLHWTRAYQVGSEKIHLEVQMAVGLLLKISKYMVPRVHGTKLAQLCRVSGALLSDCSCDRQKQICGGPPSRSYQNTTISSHSTYKTWLTYQCQPRKRTARV